MQYAPATLYVAQTMADLPKIARARLTVKSGAPGALSDEGEFVALGGHHPDANLLTAFAEKALTGTERARVLHHLNHCAECREVTALALPESVTETTTSPKFSPWPILRWGALAAMMAALALVITLHPSLWQNREEVTGSAPRANSTGNTGGTPVATPLPAAAPPSISAIPRASLPARKPLARTDALNKKSLAASERSAPAVLALQHVAKQQVTTLDSTQPPAQIQSAPSANAEQNPGGAAVAQVQAAPSVSDSTAPLQQSQTSYAGPQNSPSGFQAAQQPVQSSGPAAATAVPRAVTQSVTVSGQAVSLSQEQTRQYSDSAQPELAKKQAAAGAFMSRSAVSSPAPRWMVTDGGQVIMMAGDNIAEAIPTAQGVKFRSVAALGDDVWAGGVGGALYHSGDRGNTWTRVAVNLDGGPVTATITGIQLGAPRHVAVTIDSGARYISDDAGQHWR